MSLADSDRSDRDHWRRLAEERFAEIKRAQAIIDELKAEREARLTDTEPDKLRAVAQAAHDLICWTHQGCVNVGPDEYSRNVKDSHPGVWNNLNAAERELFTALKRL